MLDSLVELEVLDLLTGPAFNMLMAVLCGAFIGSERQVRQRLAGIRTNALVALGAACFVIFSAMYDDLSPTRVGAQVVSGIGFLGAGIIFRDGFTVHGLNTAATLWCAAAVGVICGAGGHAVAAIATGVVIFVNLGLRPLVKWVKRKTRAGLPMVQEYRILMTCRPSDEQAVRNSILAALSASPAHAQGFDVETSKEDEMRLDLTLAINDRSEESINSVISPLLIDPAVLSLSWEAGAEG
ncbi:magnesium transport protein MgtC [Tritonibacter multivorans]|uniref:Protein MgtC n=1 Tax=Tritonibacter multivorans TaxID=928856 RepID=A0A0N7M138_9RHOB|nr:MgtC/SapB family protein [Tritonibacter multivorans]MDA7421554.1 MgtC/SapB family protein [Tritonibacter multivorans]CUH82185.1 magnesium transport protein MgtC [Tritonibacter multivorans]SFC95794.1 putative Mg2+ transporter-C (MgtC) family protein [Tritonibacter multivorans]